MSGRCSDTNDQRKSAAAVSDVPQGRDKIKHISHRIPDES